MAGLTTHVLDVVRGGPAEGVRIELYEALAAGERRLVADVPHQFRRADRQARSSAPKPPAGRFELIFHVGDYFRRRGAATADPPFLDLIPIRFAIADPQAHYHVPLLVSPWSYSTYRGS